VVDAARSPSGELRRRRDVAPGGDPPSDIPARGRLDGVTDAVAGRGAGPARLQKVTTPLRIAFDLAW